MGEEVRGESEVPLGKRIEIAVNRARVRKMFLPEHVFALLLGDRIFSDAMDDAIIDIVLHLTGYSLKAFQGMPPARVGLLVKACQLNIGYQLKTIFDERRRDWASVEQEIESLRSIKEEGVFIERCDELAGSLGFVGGVIALA
jgi:hypothetical protein